MKPIKEGLKNIEGYLFTVKRDTVNGWYVLEVGIPPKWIYKGNEFIDCEVINKTESGSLIKIKPRVENVCIDDLVTFTELIIETNSKIVEREEEFKKRISEVKEKLNAEKDMFYEELEQLKEKSFSIFNELSKNVPNIKNVGDTLKKQESTKRGRGRPKGSKNKNRETTQKELVNEQEIQ